MMLIEETTVPQSALPVAELKDHLRLGSGFADDGLQDGILETCLRAAMAAIEARTGKILIEREFSWTVRSWRQGDEQSLPVAPVNVVSAINLIDHHGNARAINEGWTFVPSLQRPVIVATGSMLPQIAVHGSAKVHFLAGFGPEWSDVPADLGQATMMLAAHFYDFRHGEASGTDMMPPSVAVTLERHRMVRIGGGL
ncbi:hypothetical protein BVC71_04205 [Marivivens niveibacter]|uniref:Phage gp6-like head-tail connector protein n=1 Tax=Marivivens niveibacter TaxID=1930667 RepID=A0A251X2Q8_9RHOB|nr:hypothetical protein [Marivivens niveibacter]OUD10695.1 hypothetical protein BVC71_04205 [Marivivens niveibacter]